MTELASDLGNVTFDDVARGSLRLMQPRLGYRFNVDALILANFASEAIQVPELVVDLGCGCGIVGLLLARRWRTCRVVLVEIQPELARLARVNAAENGLTERVQVMCADLTDVTRWAPRNRDRALVVTNPPYFRLGAGRTSRDPMVAIAKHELKCTLSQLLDAAVGALAVGQAFVLVHDARRRSELLAELERRNLTLLRERLVLPRPRCAANRVLYQVGNGPVFAPEGHQPLVEPPLVIHESPGVYSAELRQILGDGFAATNERPE